MITYYDSSTNTYYHCYYDCYDELLLLLCVLVLVLVVVVSGSPGAFATCSSTAAESEVVSLVSHLFAPISVDN